MVDVINCADTLAEVDEVADRSKDIVNDDVLGNKLVSALLYIFLKLVSVCGSLKDLTEYLEGDLLVDTVLLPARPRKPCRMKLSRLLQP